jgi:hypothetical protein
MTKRSRRSSSRPSRSPPRRARPAKPLPIPWWKRPIPVILTLGAVAGAITAILALIQPILPKHSPLNVARFVSVRALSQVPLNEFRQRSTIYTQSADHPPMQGPRLIVAVSGQTLIQDSTPTAAPSPTSVATPTATTSPATSATPTATTSPTATATPSVTSAPTTTPPTSAGIRFSLPGGLASGAYTRKVAYLVENNKTIPEPPKNRKADIAILIRVTGSDGKGNLVPPEVAAKRIIGVLGHTQTVSETPNNQNSGSRNEREPLGELISLNMELVGLRGQPVFLSWSIFQAGGHNNLFGRWLNNFVAYRLVATTDDDTGSLDMWIPLPKVTGPYFIRLNLTSGGADLASTDSDPFS